MFGFISMPLLHDVVFIELHFQIEFGFSNFEFEKFQQQQKRTIPTKFQAKSSQISTKMQTKLQPDYKQIPTKFPPNDNQNTNQNANQVPTQIPAKIPPKK